MGNNLSQIFRSGSALLSNRDGHKVSEGTAEKVQTIFDCLRANPKISVQRLEALLLQIPKVNSYFFGTYRHLFANFCFLFSV